MAVAYRSEFTSLNGVDWKLEIDDALGLAPAQEFKVDGRGFVLNYQGNEQDIFNPVISSTVTFGIVVEKTNSAILEQFVLTLVGSAEERFKLAVYRENQLYWAGIILQDGIRQEDLDLPLVEIQAVDGLARLNRKEYRFTSPIFHDTFLVHLDRIMAETQTQSFWGGGDYMKIVVNWYEATHGTVGTNSLEEVSFANHIFTDVDPSGNAKAKSYLQVLQEICKIWGARLFQANGYYYFVQIGEYDEDDFREWTYDTDLDTPTATNATQNYEIEVDKTTRYKLAVMQKNWLPPLLRATVNYKHYTDSANVLRNFFWTSNTTAQEETITELVHQTGGNTRIELSALVEYTSNVDSAFIASNGYPVHRYKWAMTLRVHDDGADYYLQRTANDNAIWLVSYGDVDWTNTPSAYEFWSDFVNEQQEGLQQRISLALETPAAYFSGTVYVKFEIVEIEDMEGNNLPTTFNQSNDSTHTWRISDLFLNIHEGGETEEVPSDDLRVYTIDGDSQNSFIKKVPLQFGDGPQANSTSALQINSLNTESWNIGNGSEGLKIIELLIKDYLAFQKLPTQVISGGIIANDIHFHHKVKDGTLFYIFMRGSFTATPEEWRGAWVQIDKDTTGTVTEVTGPIEIDDSDKPTYTDDVNGGGGGGTPTPVDDGDDNLDLIVTDLISLTRTTQNVIAGTNYTSISVLPVDAFIPSGSSVALVRPDTGLTEIITLTDDYNPNDTTISVNHTFTNSFPANTFVFPDYTAIINNSNTPSKAQVEPVRAVIGATYTIANFDLPDPNNVTDQEINRRLRIERGGLRIYYPLQFTIDVTGANNNIVPVLINFAGETMYAELID